MEKIDLIFKRKLDIRLNLIFDVRERERDIEIHHHHPLMNIRNMLFKSDRKKRQFKTKDVANVQQGSLIMIIFLQLLSSLFFFVFKKHWKM